MKRMFIALTIMTLLAGGYYIAFASEHGEHHPMNNDNANEENGMMQMPEMENGMACPMMAAMMGREIVPTEDGGVVVMVGPMLVKYDAELNLVGRTEIQIDMERMRQRMMQMMENCPMCRQMMERRMRRRQ